MIKAAQDEELKTALTSHREETAEQIEILENVFSLLELPAKGQKCDAIDGILEEATGILDDFGKTSACDAAIIFAAQAVEHYEWTRYGCLRQFAIQLGRDDVADQFQIIRDQESAADEKLTALAEGRINAEATEPTEGSAK